MFLQPAPKGLEVPTHTRTLSQHARALGLSVVLPERPQLETILASIKRQSEEIIIPQFHATPQNMSAVIEALGALPNGSNITLTLHQFACNPHDEPREHLIRLWNTVKHKVKLIVWDQNKFFKSFVASIQEELKRDASVARCEFPNCEQTNSGPMDEPNPVFSFPKLDEFNFKNDDNVARSSLNHRDNASSSVAVAQSSSPSSYAKSQTLSFFAPDKDTIEEDTTMQKECADAMLLLSKGY